MRTLKTSEAADLLNVSANTLRAWEERFGYPQPERSPGGHRLYRYAEIEALRRALHDGLSGASAASRARESLAADVRALVSALLSFSPGSADSVLEASLALKPIERAIEDLLLASLDELLRRCGRDSAAWAFASVWGSDWLRRTRRLVEPPESSLTLLVLNATEATAPAAPHMRALEFFCAQRGAEVLTIAADATVGLTEAVTSVCPHAIVLAGDLGDRHAVARWLYSVSNSIGLRPVASYRREATRVEVRGGIALDEQASRAQRQVFALANADRNGAAKATRHVGDGSLHAKPPAFPALNGATRANGVARAVHELATARPTRP